MSILGLAIHKGLALKHTPPTPKPKLLETPTSKLIAGFIARQKSLKRQLELSRADNVRLRKTLKKLQRGMVSDLATTNKKGEPSVANIVKFTIDYFNNKNPENQLFTTDMVSHRRYPSMVRHIAMYLAKILTSDHLPSIGRKMGRDHSTILHGVRKIERLRKSDPALDADIKAIIGIIEGVNVPNAVLAKPVESA